MKARHIFAILVGAVLIVWSLASCNPLNSVSISQRIADFQADLNTSSRSNVYQDFHPTMTTEYNALKDPNLSGFNTEFPATGQYSLTDSNDSNPAAVIVTVNAGSPGTGSGLTAPYYLQLNMATYNGNDNRIVTLSDSSSIGGPYNQKFF
ncbi:MAG: hypothetical protein ABSG21_08380 [Spirochaetia bacterium]|jgi:hypothetical protein